jgi:ribonuclease Y
MEIIIAVGLAVLTGLLLGTVGGYFGKRLFSRRSYEAAKQEASEVLATASEEKRRILIEAKEESLRIRSEEESEHRQRRSEEESEHRQRRAELQRLERRLSDREENAERRALNLERSERNISHEKIAVEDLRTEIESLKSQGIQKLEEIANLSVTEAQEQLTKRAEEDMQHELAVRYRIAEEQAKEEANDRARDIIALAAHRLASDVVSEVTLTSVPIPTDDMKGRLIGREGRNIRAIEKATGVDLIVDDTPEAVTLSCFDPIRREVARLAIGKLVADGRIHPARIEETVIRTEKELDETIRKTGEQTALDVGTRGLSPELIRLLGRLKYRFSYGENVLQHSIEVGRIAGMMAAEIGADAEVAKTGGLLHDIGKALTHEVEGPHAEIGAEVAARNNIPPRECATIKEHHDDVHTSAESFIVAAADAISAARPGSRRDTVEHYIKRLEALEEVARGFDGVEKCFAIQAGREIRILVKPEDVDDLAATKLSRDIVKKIEETLQYPGQIKVTVIRESRAVEYAR